MDNPKIVQAICNAVVRATFYNEAELNAQYLHSELFAESETSLEELEKFYNECAALYKTAARDDVDLAPLEAQLATTSWEQVQQAAFLRTWRTQRVKIRDALVERSRLNSHLKNLSWRVDVKTKSKATAAQPQELNEAVAMAELVLGAPSAEQQDRVLRFEMSRDQVQEAVQQLNRIQAQLDKLTGQHKPLLI